MKKGMNNNHLKNSNRGLILKLIASQNEYSRADITGMVNLTKMTVSNIVNDFIETGFVVESKKTENNTVGRNPITLSISPTAPKIIGLYISRNSLHCVLSSLSLDIIHQTEMPLCNETPDTLDQKIVSIIKTILSYTSDSILGLGISAIGPLDIKTGRILNPTNFFGISNYPVQALIEREFKIPCLLNNDMNACALTELYYGAGQDWSHFLYVGISNGIGSGIITDGKLYQNNSPYAGELGHMVIEFDGPLCSCGRRGCLEAYINMPSILNKIRDITEKPELTYADLPAFGADPKCRPLFQDISEKLTCALVNTVNLLDPQGIIIGHEGAYLPAEYISKIEEVINQDILAVGHRHITVRTSSLKLKAPLLGGVCLVLDQLFSGNFDVD